MGRAFSRSRPRTVFWLVALVMTAFPCIALAHPSPDDIPGIARHELALILSLLAVLASVSLYLYVGLRRSNRALTVREYFFYDKKVTPRQYSDTTVAYSFQVVVTIYFVFWGFRYGIGIFIYALMWMLGLWLFQAAAPRLLEFARSTNTLHSFLGGAYGDSRLLRRLTAFCTLFGLGGALLVEVSLGVDLLGRVADEPWSSLTWVGVFAAILAFTWAYVRFGGYKAAVNTDAIQLRLTYLSLLVVFLYVLWMAFDQGYYEHSVALAVILFTFWLAIYLARKKSSGALRDPVTAVAGFCAVGTLLASAFLAVVYHTQASVPEPNLGLPSAFGIDGLLSQDKIVIASFFILNIAWQFFDMAAWQRISSLDLKADDTGAIQQIRSVISETKWESPITWSLGILLGIGLRHTGLFDSGDQAFDSMFLFVHTLSHNDLSTGLGALGSYVVLPAVLLAFVGIMLSTVDSFLSTVTYAWIHDVQEADDASVLDEAADESKVLGLAQNSSTVILVVFGGLFLLFTRGFGWNVLLVINTIYSAQFALTFPVLGSLLLSRPEKGKGLAIGGLIAILVVDFLTAYYCYRQMLQAPQSSWADWYYVLPTVAAAAIGVVVFVVMVFRCGLRRNAT